jgi:hypothetical protein
MPQNPAYIFFIDGQGYVLVPDAAEQYGLLPGIATEGGPDRFAVSMYHQIHCLVCMTKSSAMNTILTIQGMIRLVYFDMVDQLERSSKESRRGATKVLEGHPDVQPDHVAHCFDYLRQALMCAGDMTIEHAREPPLGQKRLTTDGWGVTHQCRNWDEMLAWTLSHKANVSHTGNRIGG